MRSLLALLLTSTLPVGWAGDRDKNDSHHHHYPEHLLHETYGGFGGLYPYYDHGSLSTLIALKIKAALLVAAVAFAVFWFYKLYGFKAHKCHHEYSHDDHGPPYHAARETDAGFTERVMKGVDLIDLSFNILDIRTDACKRKFVCHMDKLTLQQPLLGYAAYMLSGSLSNYRNSDSEVNYTTDCASLYPECTTTGHTTYTHETEVSSSSHHIKIKTNPRLVAS